MKKDLRARSSSGRAPSARRLRRKNKQASTIIHDLPDKLLKLVLLRLDSSACLVRAASTCRRWRGIIAASDDFLRLSRTLHRPLIAGHYHLEKDPSEFVPSSSSPDHEFGARRFSSLDFLPAGNRRWEVADCHGGLVLLRQPEPVVFPDLVVCDPVARRYQGITHPQVRAGYNFADASLLDPDGDSAAIFSMHNYRVLYRFFMGPRACVFTAGEPGGDWRELDELGNDLDHFTMAHVAGRLDGSQLCMGLMHCGRAILLDNSTLEFSYIDLPTNKDEVVVVDPSSAVSEEEEEEDYDSSYFRVVHSDLMPKATRIVHVWGQELEVFRQQQGAGEWVLEHHIPRLSEACRGVPGYPEKKRFDWIVDVAANGAGFVVLSVLDCGRKWLFSVDVETMKMAAVPDRTYDGATCPYTLPWPPVFVACLAQNRRRRRS
ncbi:hypothetical protein QOZ80_2BG0162790 [Eleusine coracana subsp. coracana]|nr:hypothetical protein QOZ80_2BG0162790 [Eleusine coracana subsp. coracana]